MSDTPEKKIIVDEDWKEEAQREKEALASAMEAEQEKQRPLPDKASFPILLSGLATQALVNLGEIDNPLSKQRELNLPEAQFHIDMLEILKSKTKGNLAPAESRMLDGLLFDLRMRFVEKSKLSNA